MARSGFDSGVTAILDGSGNADAEIGRPPLGYEWRIDRLSVEQDTGEVRFYEGAYTPSGFQDVTTVTEFNIAPYAYLWIPVGSRFLVRFLNGTAGTRAYAYAHGILIPA